MTRPPHRLAAALLTAASLALVGCSGTAAAPATSSSGTTLTVLAAASLKESFDEIISAYQAAHPGTTIKVSYGGSSALAQQVVSGAPADVFAAASTATMETASKAGAVDAPVTFARNTMEIAVPTANPAKVTGLPDLAGPSVKVALCQAEVPCGAASTKLLAKDRLTVRPVTLEPDVKSVLTKVELGEVDAGIVYVTDVTAAGSKVTGITIPDGQNVTTTYPIAVVRASTHPDEAKAFEDYVTSADGRKVLAAHGFAAP